MNKLSWLFLALFIAAAGFATIAWNKSQALTRDHATLQARVQELETDLRKAQSDAETAARSSDFSQDNKLELMRLRNEVSQLRAKAQNANALETEVAQLRTQNQELRTEAANTPAPNPAAANAPTRFTRDQWAYSGNGTPQAALLTSLATMANSPDNALREATGLQILEEQQVSPNHVEMKVYLEGSSEMKTVTMQNDGTGWQMAVMQTATYDPLSFYRRNPELMRRYFPHLVQGEPAAPVEGADAQYGFQAETTADLPSNHDE